MLSAALWWKWPGSPGDSSITGASRGPAPVPRPLISSDPESKWAPGVSRERGRSLNSQCGSFLEAGRMQEAGNGSSDVVSPTTWATRDRRCIPPLLPGARRGCAAQTDGLPGTVPQSRRGSGRAGSGCRELGLLAAGSEGCFALLYSFLKRCFCKKVKSGRAYFHFHCPE